jgi:hypothetical protein
LDGRLGQVPDHLHAATEEATMSKESMIEEMKKVTAVTQGYDLRTPKGREEHLEQHLRDTARVRTAQSIITYLRATPWDKTDDSAWRKELKDREEGGLRMAQYNKAEYDVAEFITAMRFCCHPGCRPMPEMLLAFRSLPFERREQLIKAVVYIEGVQKKNLAEPCSCVDITIEEDFGRFVTCVSCLGQWSSIRGGQRPLIFNGNEEDHMKALRGGTDG